MLTGHEIDIVKMEVSTFEDSELLSNKQIFISKGEDSGLLMKHNTGRGGNYGLYEKDMHIAAEFLVWIDQRLEGKNSWLFRFIRRLKYVNQFRP